MSIRMRLALLFTLVVALLLACFGAAIYAFASWQRAEVFTGELEVNGMAAATIALRSDDLSDSLLEPYRKNLASRLHDESIEILTPESRSVYSRGEHSHRLAPAEISAILAEGVLRSSRRDTQQVGFLFRDDDKPYVVVISAVDAQGLKTLAKLRWGLLIGYVSSLLIVFAAGRWFARRIIAPLARITRQAESISARDLHVRVEAGTEGDELQQLARAFNGMLDRLEKAFRSQRQFIANASHELRTPLTTMEGQMEVALMNRREIPEYRQALRAALEETRSLRRVMNNLLLLAKTESGLLSREMRTHRLDEILISALEEAGKRHPGRTADLEYASVPDEESALFVEGNEDLLRNALANVLENAMKYSPAHEPVGVTLASAGGGVEIRISDRGIGIPAEDMPRVFDPFFRSARAQSVSGSGVGLTLARAVFELHRGRVELSNRPGGGTLVRISLPTVS